MMCAIFSVTCLIDRPTCAVRLVHSPMHGIGACQEDAALLDAPSYSARQLC